MHRANYWLLLGGCALLAALCLRWTFQAWRKNRIIADTPTARIRSAAQGFVEFIGWGALPAPPANKGPLTGIPCVWWSYRIEELQRRNKGSEWVTIDAGTSEIPFFMEDGSGRCLVDPRGAEVRTHQQDRWTGTMPRPARIIDGAAGFKALGGSLGENKYRYVERRLMPKEPLYALGELRSQGGAQAFDAQHATGAILSAWKQDQAQLLARFDADQDGQIDAAEWEAARRAAQAQAQREYLEQTPATPVHVLAEPRDGRAFILAACDEETLAGGYRRRAFAGLCGFVAAAAAMAWTATQIR